MSLHAVSSSQPDLFPELLTTLDQLDHADRVKELAQRAATVCADEGKDYLPAHIEATAGGVLALKEAQAHWPDWLKTYVQNRPATRDAIDAKRATLMLQSKARRRKTLGRLAMALIGSIGIPFLGSLLFNEKGPFVAVGIGLFLITAMLFLMFSDSITPEELECQNDLKIVVPNEHGWPKLAASVQASALYRAWTSSQNPITDKDWCVLMDVAAMEAGEKAKRQVLATG